MQQHDSTRSRRRLPDDVLAGLREAYAGEVAERLPRLLDAARAGDGGPDVLRDAHSLGSSSYVVGEADAGDAARAVEARLLAGEPFAAELDVLVARLQGWRP